MKFPTTLYIVVENEGFDDEFYAVGEEAEALGEFNESRPIARYSLQEVGTVDNKTSYTPETGRK